MMTACWPSRRPCPRGTGTNLFEERFPERFVDVGICEQHAVTFAAGLAASGFHPVVAIYSTFCSGPMTRSSMMSACRNFP